MVYLFRNKNISEWTSYFEMLLCNNVYQNKETIVVIFYKEIAARYILIGLSDHVLLSKFIRMGLILLALSLKLLPDKYPTKRNVEVLQQRDAVQHTKT